MKDLYKIFILYVLVMIGDPVFVNCQNIIGSLNNASSKNEIFVKKNSTLVKVKYDDIIFIEALENYVVFNTFNEKFTVHYTMKSLEEKLPDNFIRVHRSYIVNIKFISEIDDHVLILKISEGDVSVPIGKMYKEKLFSTLQIVSKWSK